MSTPTLPGSDLPSPSADATAGDAAGNHTVAAPGSESSAPEAQFPLEGTSARLTPARVPQTGLARLTGSRAVVDTGVRHELSKLVQRVFLPVGGAGASRSVMFTAAWPGREAETACAATAEILTGHTARTVCLVDANLREPSLHRRFGVQNTAGLSDLLLGAGLESAVAVKLGARFWLVPAGPRLAGPGASHDEFRRCVATLLATFDFVLFSASSLGAGPDTLTFAPEVDGVVLLVDAESTRREAARRAVETLRTANARVLGITLTSGRPVLPHALGA